jgi:hypothetical protein
MTNGDVNGANGNMHLAPSRATVTINPSLRRPEITSPILSSLLNPSRLKSRTMNTESG